MNTETAGTGKSVNPEGGGEAVFPCICPDEIREGW